MTIGQSVGIIDHAFSITNSKDEKVTVSVKIDCRTASDADIKGWIVSNRIIAGQRPWRSLSTDELKALNGTTFIAQSIGQKVKSREEKIQALEASGLPRKLAVFAVDNPDKFQEAVGDLEVGEDVK